MTSSEWDDFLLREGNASDLGRLELRGEILNAIADLAGVAVRSPEPGSHSFQWLDVLESLTAYLNTRDDCHTLVSERVTDNVPNVPPVAPTFCAALDIATQLSALDAEIRIFSAAEVDLAKDPTAPWLAAARFHNAVLRIRPLGAYNLLAAQVIAYFALLRSAIDFPHFVLAPRLRHAKSTLTIAVYEQCIVDALHRSPDADLHMHYHFLAQRRQQDADGVNQQARR